MNTRLFTAATTLMIATMVSAEPLTSAGEQREMNVTATVTPACSDLTVSDLAFGAFPASDTAVDQTVDILVTCSNGIDYSIELDYGVNGLGAQRRVQGDTPGTFIDYQIFQPGPSGGPATTTAWGEASDGAAYSQTGTGSEQTLTATGRLDLLSGTPTGEYSDLVLVTISF